MMAEQYGVNQSKLKIKGDGYLQEQYISLTDLRKVSGIGDKTIERIKEQLLQNELDDNYKSEYNPNIKLDINDIYQGDCLELMNGIPDNSIDMILCDLPYGTTSCFWDEIIPFNKLWKQYKRIVKSNSAIVLFGNQPFTTKLINSHFSGFKYTCVWKKSKCGSPFTAKYKPLTKHEDILIFEKNGGKTKYNPQMEVGTPYKRSFTPNKINNMKFGVSGVFANNTGTRHPITIFDFPQNWRRQDQIHPTQKPIELFEYLIKTYSDKGDLILDNCIGSGTTAIACINTNRNYIGIELDENYYNIAKNRINEHKSDILIN